MGSSDSPRGVALQHPQARALILFSIVLLAVAVAPTSLGDALAVAGMDARVARMAGSRLAVMAALSGAGMLLVGISLWARADRLLRISEAHARMLEHLGAQTVAVVEGPTAVAFGEFDGLRADIVVPPEVGGSAVIRAPCHPAVEVEVWPRGLPPEDLPPGTHVTDSGQFWEAWSSRAEPVLVGGEGLLEGAFAAAGVFQVSHDRSGIRISLPSSPAESLPQRLKLSLRLASFLARSNR